MKNLENIILDGWGKIKVPEIYKQLDTIFINLKIKQNGSMNYHEYGCINIDV